MLIDLLRMTCTKRTLQRREEIPFIMANADSQQTVGVQAHCILAVDLIKDTSPQTFLSIWMPAYCIMPKQFQVLYWKTFSSPCHACLCFLILIMSTFYMAGLSDARNSSQRCYKNMNGSIVTFFMKQHGSVTEKNR